jgi:hypothetical protein
MDRQIVELTRQAEDALRQLRHCLGAFSAARKRTKALRMELTNQVRRQTPNHKMVEAEPHTTRVQPP